MIYSLVQIDLINPAGGSVRLLDHGDRLEQLIDFGFAQGADEWAPVYAEWGYVQPGGAARQSIEWTREINHASHAAAMGYCLSHPASLPTRQPRTLRVTIEGGQVWDLHDAALLSAHARPSLKGKFRTQCTYRASVGRALPVEPIDLYAGIPWSFILQEWADIDTDWSAL